MAYQHAGRASEDDIQAAVSSAADAYSDPAVAAAQHYAAGPAPAAAGAAPQLGSAYIGQAGTPVSPGPSGSFQIGSDPADIPLSALRSSSPGPARGLAGAARTPRGGRTRAGYRPAAVADDDYESYASDEDNGAGAEGDGEQSAFFDAPAARSDATLPGLAQQQQHMPERHVQHGSREPAAALYGKDLHDDQPGTSAAGAAGNVPAWSDQQGTLVGNKDGFYGDEKARSRVSLGGRPGDSTPPSRPMSSAGLSSADEDETDDFDWDTDTDEDDLDEADAQEKQSSAIAPDGRKKRIRARRGRAIYLCCMRLARPVRILVIAGVLTILALVPFIVVLAAFPDKPARAQVQVWSIWIAIIIAASAGTYLFVEWIPSLLMRLAVAVYGKAPEVFKFYVEVIMAVAGYVKILGCVAWAWISLGGVLAIQFAYANRPPYFVWIFRILQALFGTACILLAEKVLLQLVAIKFHKTAVRDRLENNQKALKVLDKLYESKYEAPSRSGRTAWSGHWGRTKTGSRPGSPGPHTPGGLGLHGPSKSRGGDTSYFTGAADAQAAAQQQQGHHHHHHSHLPHRHHKDKQPSEHDLAKAARRANFASQLSEALQMATLKSSKLYKGRQTSSSAQSARRLAKKLFHNLSHHRKYLVAEDFIPYFKNEEEAKEAFAVFDADKNGDITKQEMREAVQRIYKERRALSASLKDISSAIGKLDGVLLFVGLIITIFVWLLIFNRSKTIANLVPLSTFVVSFSFVFGNTLKTIFESMIFIFATHPYDSGDLVCVDDVWMFVKDFGLISTTFRTTTNEEVVAPNALLATSKYIHNARRSGSQWEVTKVTCSFETGLATIDEFRKRLRAYVKENDREWGGGLDVNFDTISNMNALSLVIAMEHKGNWQDWGARWARRTKLMREIKDIATSLGMEYQLPSQPITFQPRSGPAPFSAPARFANLQRNAMLGRRGSSFASPAGQGPAMSNPFLRPDSAATGANAGVRRAPTLRI